MKLNQYNDFQNVTRRLALTFASLLLAGSAFAQDRTVFFDVDDPGVDKSISIWGLDTAWLSESNVARGVEFMGKEQVDVIRFSFTGDKPLVGGDLESTRQAEFDERMQIVDTYTKPDAALYFNNDSDGIDPWFMDGTTKVRADRWAELIDVTRQKCEDAGRTVLSIAPFNEPDNPESKQGNVARMLDVCVLLRTDPKYKDSFRDIRIAGGNTLNNDNAISWYSTLKDYLDEGNTHQLAGNFDSYASFFEYVKERGDYALNDELHNVMEAMVGAEYGMDAGIWWGSAEYARGEFVKASDGRRLGYAEHRGNWTAASVYRAPDGKVQAFVGESERQARRTSYQFVSKGRDVYFDGVGPQRTYTVNTTGGPGYQTAAHKNAERMVNITWGEDIQPVIDGRYTLVNRQSGKVMEVADGSTENGTNIRQGSPAYSNHQSWLVDPVPSSIGGDWTYFSIKPFHDSSKTGDVWNWNLDAGADVRLYDYVGGTNQQWILEYVEDGYFYIRSRFSGKYLEVADGVATDGANVQLGAGPGGYQQQWRLLPAGAMVEFEAPAKPSGLSAKANAVSVALNWDANVESDLSGYSVYRSTAPDGPYELIARGVTSHSFVDKTANQGGPFYYRLKAVDQSRNHSEYSSQVVATPKGGAALVMALDFEGSLADRSGNGNEAEVSIDAAYLDGRVGSKSLYFNGANSFASLPATVADSDQLTVSCWVYWSGGVDNQRVFEFGDDSDSCFYLIPKASGGGLGFVVKDQGVESQLNGSALETNRWTHLSVVLGEAKAQLYVDGLMIDEASNSIKPSDIESVLNFIGKSPSGAGALFRGRIDDFQIHNHALIAGEVAAVAGVAAPAVPSAVSSEYTGSEIRLDWADVPGATHYTVQRSDSSDGPFVAVASDLLSHSYVDSDAVGSTKFYYKIAAGNEAGESLYSESYFVSLLSLGEEWRLQHFGITENTGDAADDADPDADGVINILERAFGGDPKVPEANLMPYLDETLSPLALVYRRALAASDLEYRVVESSDLTSPWQTAEGSSEILKDDGMVQWIRFVRPMGAGEVLFLRLQVKKK